MQHYDSLIGHTTNMESFSQVFLPSPPFKNKVRKS